MTGAPPESFSAHRGPVLGHTGWLSCGTVQANENVILSCAAPADDDSTANAKALQAKLRGVMGVAPERTGTT